MTLGEIAERTGRPVRVLRLWARRGRIPTTKVGRDWLVLEEDLPAIDTMPRRQRVGRRRLGHEAAPGLHPVRGMTFYDSGHALRWDVPDWIDPSGHYVQVAWSSIDPEEACYVGVTSRPMMRLAQHAQGSLWWQEADHIDLHRHPTRASAEKHEADLIARLDPIHNVIGRSAA